jgi:hypothetical protein
MNKQRVLCVCGSDMQGKSTLVTQISKLSNICSYKAKNEQLDFVSSQNKFLQHLYWSDTRQLDLLEQTKFSMIMDRGWPCEWVYSRFYNRITDDEQLFKNDARYAALGTNIVFCYRTSYDGLQDDLDSNLTGENLQKIHNLYEEFLKLTKCKVTRVCLDPTLSSGFFDEKQVAKDLVIKLNLTREFYLWPT